MTDTVHKGWTRPGPFPPGGIEPEEDESLDYLCGHFRIFQYKKGHRFSVDDLMAAWFGTTWCPSPRRILDLGSGIGSVGITAAWRCPGAVVHTVEAQELSLRLAEKSVRYNGLGERYFLHSGDLRDAAILDGQAPFDLVLGSPPYWPVTTRVAAAHPQAVPARLEVRGDVADYARAAYRRIAPGGVYACVFPRDQAERAIAAYDDAGFVVLHRRDVIFKQGQDYGLCLLAGSRAVDLPAVFDHHPGLPVVDPPLVVRCADGTVHPSIAVVRLAVGFSPGLLPITPDDGPGET